MQAAGSLGLQASLSSPPRPATAAGYLRGTGVAPSYCLAGGKTRRRRRRQPGGLLSGVLLCITGDCIACAQHLHACT